MRRTFVMALLLLGALVTAGIVIAAGASEPEQPPWIGADGRLAPESARALIEVAGPDGKPVVCANGLRLRIRAATLFSPPPDPEILAGQQRSGNEDLVWRCGKGANPHLSPRLVPIGQDPLRAGG